MPQKQASNISKSKLKLTELSIRLCARLCARLLKDEGGQATIEYVLLLSITIVGAITLTRAVFKIMDEGILQFGGELERNLKTGRTSVGIWKN